MSSKSYSTTTTSILNTPKTIALQDDAILAEGGSSIHILDEGAISKAFSFADRAFDRASDTTDKSLKMAGIFSDNERANQTKALDTVSGLAKKYSDNEKANMHTALQFAESTFMQGSNLMNDALHYKASEQAERNEAKEGERELLGGIMSREDGSQQNWLFYAGLAGGIFTIMKAFKVI